MVNYNIGFVDDNSNVIEINLERYLKKKELSSLDAFTSTFYDEADLKQFLFNNDLINYENLNGKISIIYKYKGKINKLPIIYKRHKEYVSMDCLKFKLMSKTSDIVFLRKLANHYNTHGRLGTQAQYISDIYNYLSDVRVNGGRVFYSNLLENSINGLYYKLTTSYDKLTDEYKIKYRGLRDLGMFLFRYDSLKVLNEEKKKLLNLKEKKTQQINFFECDYNFSDDYEYEEPLFPPNSEEEKRYMEYLENLPNEYCDIETKEGTKYK